jgi:catechol 2,3-dioxygenase-like lactoylglutathione lyase family enzyme
MTANVTGFHHVGLITRDMDHTIARYERLGFFFTPLSQPRISLGPGRPPEPFGAGNRTAILTGNYLEVLGYTDLALWNSTTPEQRGAFNLDIPLARYEGMHVMHVSSDDIAAMRDKLVAAGVECMDIRSFERNVDTADGEQMMKALAFAFPRGAYPEGLVQVAQHLTPELVLQPRFMSHPNGARLVTESIICAADPGAYASKYGVLTGNDVRRVDGHLEVGCGPASRITVVSPDQVTDVVPGGAAPAVPSMVGFTVAVADLGGVRDLLADAGVPFGEHQGRLVVAAADACGSAVLFEASAQLG